jgi:hypothetical protein
MPFTPPTYPYPIPVPPMPKILSLSRGTLIGAGLATTQFIDVVATRFEAGVTASLQFNGAEVAAPAVEVINEPPAPGLSGTLRVTFDMAALVVGPHVMVLTDPAGSAPGVQVFMARG